MPQGNKKICPMPTEPPGTSNEIPRFLINTVKKVDKKKDFTLVLGFSRRWCIKPFFEAFNELKIPMDRCHLLVYCNKDSGILIDQLKKRTEVYLDAFKSVRMYCSYRRSIGTMKIKDTDPAHRGKLPFIYAMYTDVLKMVDTTVMVVMEDDSPPPPNAIMRLLMHMKAYNNKVFVTGIETNRGPHENIKTRLGVHYIKREGNRILERVSLDPNTKGVVPVDACGWYCCATTPKIWAAGFKGLDEYFANIPRFALDMFHTNNIKNMDIPVIADFEIWCYHMEPRTDKILYWGKKQAVPMMDIWIPEYNVYAEGIVLPKGKRTIE